MEVQSLQEGHGWPCCVLSCAALCAVLDHGPYHLFMCQAELPRSVHVQSNGPDSSDNSDLTQQFRNPSIVVVVIRVAGNGCRKGPRRVCDCVGVMQLGRLTAPRRADAQHDGFRMDMKTLV